MPSGHSAELPHLPCSSRLRPELPLSQFRLGLLDRLGRLVPSDLLLRLPLLDRSLPPDPALLSLLPDLPGLLLQLLLLLPPGPALLPLQPGLLLRLPLSVPSDLLLRSLLLLPPGPVFPSLRPGLSDPSLPPGPALLSLRPDLPDLLLRLLLLDPALLSLRLDLSDLLLPLLLLDQSLLPDLALLSLPPGPAPLSDLALLSLPPGRFI